MEPINSKERSYAITKFVVTYMVMIALLCFLFFFAFVAVPKKQGEMTALTNDQVERLIAHTNDADTLVMQIQRAQSVDAKALVPLFRWTDDLQAVYKQPFYTSIIKSYTDLFNEIVRSKGQDTTLPSLKTQMTTLQKQNLQLMQEQEQLNADLAAAKAAR